MPLRIRLPAVSTAATALTPPLAVASVSAGRFLSTTAPRRAKEDDENDMAFDEVEVDMNKQAKEGFKTWLLGPGRNFKKPLYNEMNYVTSYDPRTWQRRGTDRERLNVPFPLNRHFKSLPILSEELKDEIYRRVTFGGQSIRNVSAQLGVGLERVAAVVRLKAVEAQWVAEGKPLATYLTKALHTMLPVTHLSQRGTQQPFHEGLQDMPSHPLSHQQTFVPVSESREFTRVDAGKEFGLPPTEEAVPHPDLIVLQKERLAGLSPDERIDRQRERDKQEVVRREVEEKEAKEREAASGVTIDQGRWKWRLKEAKTGSVGFRYGVPHQDRKKGQVKIPTRV